MKNQKIKDIVYLVSEEIYQNTIRKESYYNKLKNNEFNNNYDLNVCIIYQENELELLKVIKILMSLK